MKKKLEQELISIAHRVLKLTGKEDLPQLYVESKNLYEKIAILHFYENHYQSLAEEIPAEKLAEKLESFTSLPTQNTVAEPLEEVANEENIQKSFATVESVSLETEAAVELIIQEVLTEEAPEFVFEETHEAVVKEAEEDIIEKTPTLFEPITDEPIEEAKTTLLEIIGEGFEDLEFIKVESNNEEVTKEGNENVNDVVAAVSKNIQQKAVKPASSLNDVLNKGITFGLNDRIAFVKHLFAGSNEDFNRVVSQLNTFETHEEAIQFIEDLVKPDYDQWAGKEEYSERFLQIVEKNFL